MTAVQLYDKPCKVRVQNESADSDDKKVSNSRIVQIRVQVKLETKTSPVHKQELIIRLTNDSDCFFLYTLILGEEEFQVLKSQQGLFVDFATFPSSFIQLVNLCKDNSPTSNYTLALNQTDSTSATLNVLETNAFRQITHLSLRFVNATDSFIKDYLAECLSTQKSTLEATEKELIDTRNRLTLRAERAEEEINRLEMKSSELQRELLTKTDQITLDHKLQLDKILSEKSKKERELEQNSRYERENLESQFRNTINSLESKVKDLETVNKELTERKFRMESQIRENHSKLSAQDDELTNLRTEVKKLRQQNHDYQAQRHEDETNIQNFKTQVALLEQEVKNKLELIDKTSQNQNGLENQQRMNEERLEDLRLHNQKLQAKLQTLGDEMMKGNEIIKKQHTQIKELRYKNDMKNMVTVEQEKVLKEKSLQADKIAQELMNMTKSKSEVDEKLKVVTKENEEMAIKIKNNDNCIQWLNKQLNEKQLAQCTFSYKKV